MLKIIMAFFSCLFVANFTRHYFGYFNLTVFGYFRLPLTLMVLIPLSLTVVLTSANPEDLTGDCRNKSNISKQTIPECQHLPYTDNCVTTESLNMAKYLNQPLTDM